MTKQCPFCAERIQADAIVCRYCHRNLPRLARGPQVSDLTVVGVIGGALLLVIAVVWWGVAHNVSPHAGRPAQPSSAEASVPGTIGAARVGDEVRLVVNSGMVVLCVDEAAYKEFTNLAVTNDTLGMAKQTQAGRSFLVPSGTKAQIIETGFQKRRVRILEGKRAGRSGWLPAVLVK